MFTSYLAELILVNGNVRLEEYDYAHPQLHGQPLAQQVC